LANVRRRSTTTISAMGKAIALSLSRAAEQGQGAAEVMGIAGSCSCFDLVVLY